jgi:hypothetical protein
MKEYFAHEQTRELVSIIDHIARGTGSRGKVFDDFLTMTLCSLSGGQMEEEYLAVAKHYSTRETGKRPIDQVPILLAKLVQLMEDTRADILGEIFEGAITYGENGQFLTPEHLADLMARLLDGGGDTVHDPCCGTGRLLLAAAKINHNRLFIGQDVDVRCVKITTINLALRGLYGYVLWGNTLSNEIKLVYKTGFNGRGFIRHATVDEYRAALPPTARGDTVPAVTPATGEQPPQTLFDLWEMNTRDTTTEE